MKKPTLRIEEQRPGNIQRADIVPTIGYAMIVDGHFKTQFSDERAAKKAAKELLVSYPMLKVEVYDASAKVRTLIIRAALQHKIHWTCSALSYRAPRRQQYPMNRATNHTATRTTTIAKANCIQTEPPIPRKITSKRSPHGYGKAAAPVSIVVIVVRRYKVSHSGL